MTSLRFQDFDFPATFDDFRGGHRDVDEVRLLVVDARDGSIREDMFANLGSYLEDSDVLAYNDVGIGPSRLSGTMAGGLAIDLCFLLLEADGADQSRWDVVLLSEGEPPLSGTFTLAGGTIPGTIVGKRLDFDGGYWVEKDRFQGWRGEVIIHAPAPAIRAALADQGKLMHPWYADLNALDPALVNPETTASTAGALVSEPARRIDAAMRAGFRARGMGELFFSMAMSFSWRQASADDRLDTYSMNAEELSFDAANAAVLNRAIADGRRVVCIGTSAARALESLPSPPAPYAGRTDLFISPGFVFRHCSALLTNLHNPMGTHVIMASAFGGRDLVVRACEQAVNARMRFGIHGDAMLVIGAHRVSQHQG
jgi:S-adenosylmethionine:tRNA ribosyltransferase-isomerase